VNLQDKDTFSKSDPKVSVYAVDEFTNKTLNKLGETEQKKNNLNPTFERTVQCDTNHTKLEFKVEDVDGAYGIFIMIFDQSSISQFRPLKFLKVSQD